MRKLAGLLVFAVVLVGAIALTKYYSAREVPAPTPPAPPESTAPVPDATPARTPGAPSSAAPVIFKPKLVTLDFASRKSYVTLELERDPARPAPEKVWVWVYFLAGEAGGEPRYCAGDPVEVTRPFALGDRTTVNVTASAASCPSPASPPAAYYARVNVSAESAFAARLPERQISYDITTATPVVVQGAQPKKSRGN